MLQKTMSELNLKIESGDVYNFCFALEASKGQNQFQTLQNAKLLET